MADCDSSTLDLETMYSAHVCTSCQQSQTDGDEKYCATCHSDCCIKCITTSHTDHNILPGIHSVVKIMKRYPTDMCISHKDEKLSMYCVTCKTPCCVSCIDESHDGHPMSTIKAIAKQADSLCAKLNDILPKLKTRYTKMRTTHANYADSVNAAITAIKNHIQALHLKLDQMEDNMLQPLISEIEDLQLKDKNIGQPLETAECLAQLYKSAKEENSQFKKFIFFTSCPPLESLQLEKDSFPEPVSFRQVSLDMLKIEQIVGSVVRPSGQFLRDENSISTCQEPKFFDVLNLKTINVCLKGRLFPTKDGKHWIISQGACTSLGYRGHVYGSKFSILDEELKKEDVYNVIDCEVTDASIIPPSDLVFTHWFGKMVWQINTAGSTKVLFDTSPMIPNGICVTKDKTLVLGLKNEDRGKNITRIVLRMYSLNSLKYLKEIETDGLGKPLFTSIKRILQNSIEDFIVDDGSNLLCINKQGSLKWKLKLDHPYYSCCDENSNIVAAAREEIKIYNSDGVYVQTLLTSTDFLQIPTSLSIDNDGLLWIGQGRSTKIVKYQFSTEKKCENQTSN